jgi:hypothetical protein
MAFLVRDLLRFLVHTIHGRLRLELLASEPDPAATVVRDDAARAVRRLQDAIDG